MELINISSKTYTRVTLLLPKIYTFDDLYFILPLLFANKRAQLN